MTARDGAADTRAREADLLTEKELREARRMLRGSPLAMPWWRELERIRGVDSISTLQAFVDAVFCNLIGDDKELGRNDVFGQGRNREHYLRALRLFEEQMDHNRFVDLIGTVHQELRGIRSMGSSGAFYTPIEVSRVCASITTKEAEVVDAVDTRGVFTVADPACGSGRTLLAFAEKHEKHLPDLRFYAQDVEKNACRMVFINMTFCGMAGQILHGNTLSGEVFGGWRTPQWRIYEAWRRRKPWEELFKTLSEMMDEPIVNQREGRQLLLQLD